MESVLRLLHSEECVGENADEANKEKLLSEIKDVSRLLAYNDCWFQCESDRDLIEACIFQHEELEARYRYLLNLAKRNRIDCAAF
jgi:hypothetical protein